MSLERGNSQYVETVLLSNAMMRANLVTTILRPLPQVLFNPAHTGPLGFFLIFYRWGREGGGGWG